jgi:hypothetical protein
MANIRTIDYKGSNSASAGTGPKGWMFWSGSTTVSGQTYSGLGMELMDTSESYLKFTTEGDGDLDIRAKKFFVGTPTSQFISGSDGDIEISSSLFHLDPANEKLIIGAGTTINASLSVNSLFVPASTTDSNAKAYISSSGVAKFGGDAAGNYDAEFYPAGDGVSKIAGWDIGPSFLSSSNIILSSSGTIQTSDFQSSLFGTGQGWKIGSDGIAEFEEARIRGTLSTAVFEKDTISAVGGAVIIANATTISGSEITSSETTFSVASSAGFVTGEYLVAKATSSTGFTEETFKIESTGSGLLMVSRSGAIPTMSSGQVLVSKGASGSGFIMLNGSSGDHAPYMQMAVRTGSGIDDLETKVMLGNLGSLASSTTFGDLSGQTGLYTDNVYLKGAISASAGDIAGWGITTGSLTGGNMEISASGKITTNTDTSKTRIVIDGSTDPSEIKFYSGSTAMFEFTTGVTAYPEYTTTDAYDAGVCNSPADTGISGIELLNSNSGMIYAGSGNDDVRITPGHIYLTGDATTGAGTYGSILHARRQIGGCRNSNLDLNSNTSTINAEYVAEANVSDTGIRDRSAISATSRLHHASNKGTPIAVYAHASTANSSYEPYSFYGNAGVMYNSDKVTLGSDSSPGSTQLQVKMNRSDGAVCNIENTNSGADTKVLIVRLNKTNPASTNKYINFQRSGGNHTGYIQGNSINDQVDYSNASDRRMKSNIRDVKYGLGDLLKIKVRDYEFNGSKHTSTGFIAQELHEVWQNGVGKTDNGTDPLPASNSDDFNPWTIDYAKITPLLVKSVQDQQKIIDELTKRLEKLEQG